MFDRPEAAVAAKQKDTKSIPHWKAAVVGRTQHKIVAPAHGQVVHTQL